jgi:hypothetical protein
MANSVYTEDLADFGQVERRKASEILALDLPEAFCDDGIKLAFNKNSGHVFLVNSDYQVAMVNNDTTRLEIFHITPYNGVEGFLIDLLETSPNEYHPDDAEYIRDCAQNESVELT